MNLLVAVCIALAIRVIPEIMGDKRIWRCYLSACMFPVSFVFVWVGCERFYLVGGEVVTEVEHELIVFCPSGIGTKY